MKRKILIVSQFFFPVNNPRSLRTTELVKEFAREGHDVTIITPRDDHFHPKFEKEFGVKIKSLCKTKFDQQNEKIVNYGFFFPVKKYLAQTLDRFFYYPNIMWMKTVYKTLKVEKGYDLLITIAVPHTIHWGASFVHGKNKRIAKTWVADCGDPFMGYANGKNKRFFYFKYFEKMWCRKVDFISVPFEGAINAYYPEFKDKIRVIPQGFEFPIINKKISNIHKEPIFVYSGSIIPYEHYYIPFFEFLINTDLDFKFIIFSKNRSLLQKYFKGIENKVIIKNYVKRIELIQTLSEVDFLIHFPYKIETQKSLKLIDYHYSKNPILSYKGSIDNHILEEFLRGDYKNKMKTENIESSKIENVCKEFLNLTPMDEDN